MEHRAAYHCGNGDVSARFLSDKPEGDCHACMSRYLRATESEKRSFELRLGEKPTGFFLVGYFFLVFWSRFIIFFLVFFEWVYGRMVNRVEKKKVDAEKSIRFTK